MGCVMHRQRVSLTFYPSHYCCCKCIFVYVIEESNFCFAAQASARASGASPGLPLAILPHPGRRLALYCCGDTVKQAQNVILTRSKAIADTIAGKN